MRFTTSQSYTIMDSWWDLGQWHGHHGSTLAIYQITCPFCMEKGNFKIIFHVEKKKPNSEKKLNFDTLECGNCKGYVMCLWSASGSIDTNSLHDYRVLPWSLRLEKHPNNWPEDIGRYWLQAHRSLTDENWDAAAVMARSALQIALRNHNASGANLKQEIDSLADKGILPTIMKEWSHNVRDLGNDSAHPKPNQPATDRRSAQDIVKFLDFLLEYLYTLPHEIEEYRKRNATK